LLLKLPAEIDIRLMRADIKTMSVKEVPSDHDFFDPAYVKHWSDSITRYRPERKKLFKAFVAEAARMKDALSVFELGCGPGFLAEALLENCDITRYTLVDFSPEMLKLSQSRLAKFKERVVFIQADFKKENWTDAVAAGFDLIVSLQAVHELRHASHIPTLYSQLYELLVPGGKILICDHVNSPSLSAHRAAHFMTVDEHLSTFKNIGFINAREICPAADLSLIAAERRKCRASVRSRFHEPRG
jgi:ubiquinone/menaquinone biosynthesis C-methylase UbiE